MKVWISKYALTQGIYEVEGEIAESYSKMFCVPKSGKTFAMYFHKPDWYETKAEAIVRAEQMRANKLKALDKQIAKIKAMRFD